MSDFKAGDLVLTKFPSYPFWPSFIIPYHYLLKALHADSPLKEVVLDEGNDGKKCCVCFLNDLTYYWADSSDMKPLTPGQIEKGKKPPKQKKPRKQLVGAFEEADGATIEQVLVDKDIIDNVEEYEDGNAFPTAEQFEQVKAAKAKPTTKLKNRAHSEPKSQPKKKKPRNVEEEHPEEEKSTNEENASEDDDKLSSEEKNKKALFFRQKLQRGLLQRDDDPTEQELEYCSEVLEKLAIFQTKITTQMLIEHKLHKVLRAIAKLYEKKDDSEYRFGDRCKAILVNWEGHIIELKSKKEEQLRAGSVENSSIITPSDADLKSETEPLNDHSQIHKDDGSNGFEKLKVEATENGELKSESTFKNEVKSKEASAEEKIRA